MPATEITSNTPNAKVAVPTAALRLNPHAFSTTMKSVSSPVRKNKLEQRSQETRELLLRAAEQVFVRDGYESADLDDIAKLAGRTKGAIYGHFENKEQIFLALVEQHALRSRETMRALLGQSKSTAENLVTLKSYFTSLASDPTFSLLWLEFKLYTIRHPDARERLEKLYRTILPANEEASYAKRLGPALRGKGRVSRTRAVHASFALLYALQVEQAFDPALFKPKDLTELSALLFDALFGTT